MSAPCRLPPKVLILVLVVSEGADVEIVILMRWCSAHVPSKEIYKKMLKSSGCMRPHGASRSGETLVACAGLGRRRFTRAINLGPRRFEIGPSAAEHLTPTWSGREFWPRCAPRSSLAPLGRVL